MRINLLYHTITYSATFLCDKKSHWYFTSWNRFQKVPDFDDWIAALNRKLKEENNGVILTHCFIDRKTL